MIKFKINDIDVEAKQGWTVLETAREYGIDIPTLCHHPAVEPSGACRLCMVEMREGDWSKLVASCIFPVKEGLNIYTETPKVHNVRRWILEMLLASCPASPEIRELAQKHGVLTTRFEIHDPEQKCLICGLCQRACDEVVGASAISIVDRGVHKKVGAPFLQPIDICVSCGSCLTVCPTDAMKDLFDTVRLQPKTSLAQLA